MGEANTQYYYELELRPGEREWLINMLAKVPISGQYHQRVTQGLRDARRVNLELPRSGLDWGEIDAEAERQGCSTADLIWDRGKASEPPMPPPE